MVSVVAAAVVSSSEGVFSTCSSTKSNKILVPLQQKGPRESQLEKLFTVSNSIWSLRLDALREPGEEGIEVRARKLQRHPLEDTGHDLARLFVRQRRSAYEWPARSVAVRSAEKRAVEGGGWRAEGKGRRRRVKNTVRTCMALSPSTPRLSGTSSVKSGNFLVSLPQVEPSTRIGITGILYNA